MKPGILLFLSIAALGQAQAPAPTEPATITLVGAVMRPGSYTFKSDLTLLRLYAKAGGPQKSASKKGIQIVRSSTRQTIEVNVDAIFRGKEPDIQLEPGDTVIVPSNARSPSPENLRNKTDFFTVPIA